LRACIIGCILILSAIDARTIRRTHDNMLSRKAIRKTFQEHRGAAARVARALGVAPSHVSHWLRGVRDSKRIEAACRAEAERLLKGDHA
jgi:hypothetical protein